MLQKNPGHVRGFLLPQFFKINADIHLKCYLIISKDKG